MYRITRNFRGSMASYYFVIKHSRLLMMDLRIIPVKEIIRHKTFAVVRKTAKSAKVSCYTVSAVDAFLQSLPQRLPEVDGHEFLQCTVAPRAKPMEGNKCPLHVKYPATGEGLAQGCGVCRNF